MANEIFTRLQLKHDTYANWMAVQDTFKPLAGEICVVEIPSANSATTTTPPTVLFKIGMYKKDASGNDTTELYTFKELNWGSALAADVYAWAKAEDVRLKDQKLEFFTGNNVIKTVDLTTFATEAEVNALLAGYKKVQTAVPDPTANGKSLTFIDTISQNTQGVITATKKNVNLDDYALKTDIPTEFGVMSVVTTDDDIVILTPETAASGAVTITGAHKDDYNTKTEKTTDETSDVSDYEDSITIMIPSFEVDKYGHTTFLGETSHIITIPEAPAVGEGDITIEAGDGLELGSADDTFNVNQNTDATITLKHAVPTGATEGEHGGTTTKFLSAVTTDEFGHVTGVTEAGLTLETTVVQNGNKAEIAFKKDDTYLISTVSFQGSNGIKLLNKEDSFDVLIDGADLKAYTDEKVAAAVAGAVDYLGTVATAEELTAKETKATHGDFVRVSVAFGAYHAGDLLIWNKTGDAAGYWELIHGEMDKDTWTENSVANDGFVKKGQGQANKVWKTDADGNPAWRDDANTEYSFVDGAKIEAVVEDGTVSFNHEEIDEPTATEGTGRTYLTGVTTDGYGHITGYTTATETDQDLDGKADKVADATDGNFAGLDADGNLTDSGYAADRFATAAQGAKADRAIDDIQEAYAGYGYEDLISGALHFGQSTGLGEDGLSVHHYINIKKGGIVTDALADGAVTTDKINNGAVTTAKIENKAVTAAKLADDVKELIKTEAATLDAVVLAESQKYTDDAIDDLHAIATSGSIYDVKEGSTANNGADKVAHPKYLIFNCGSSTEVI